MLLSRAKAATGPNSSTKSASSNHQTSTQDFPKLANFLIERDYTGALTLLEFERTTGTAIQPHNWLWTGYASFHLGDYMQALQVYTRLIDESSNSNDSQTDPLYYLYLSVTQFYLGMYEEADANAKRGPQCKLQNRVHFHVSHKLNEEKRLMYHHQHLQDVVEDQLTLASIHYLRGHYQEAIDIYKRLLGEHPEYYALNVYLALCYYKLDYYDVAQEVLALYLAREPDSVTAGNLKACNHFRLYNGKAAELELKSLLERMSTSGATIGTLMGNSSAGNNSNSMNTNRYGGVTSSKTVPVTKSSLGSGSGQQFAADILRHNLVVFRNGEGALGILEPLVDIVPEARLNLALWHLRHEDIVSAYELMRDVDPASPSEYILKAIVYAVLGQAQDSRDHLKQAQQYLQLVGSSASECDTIAGRQCMASCFFLLRHFEDVLIYLNSIKAYFFNDDTFNYNYGQAKAELGSWSEAIEAFNSVQDEKMRSEFTYISYLAKCNIVCNKARQAWELYLKMDTSSESFTLLQLIAHESYRTQQYLYSAKAFDVLERLDPDAMEHWEGKRGACLGTFQQVVQGRESRDTLNDVLMLLRNSNNPQVEYLMRMIRRWAGTGLVTGQSIRITQ